MGIIKELLRRKEIITPDPETLRSQFEGVKEQVLPLSEEVRRKEEIPTVGIEPSPGPRGGWTKITFYNGPISQEEKLEGKNLKLFLVSREPPKFFPLTLRFESLGGLKGRPIEADLVGTILEEGTYRIYASSPQNKWLFSVTY